MSNPITADEAVFVLNALCYGESCSSCGGINEPYMIKHNLWKRVSKSKPESCICLCCTERKLRRALQEQDFLIAPINFGIFAFHQENWLKAVDYMDFLRLTRDFLEKKREKLA